MFRLLMFSKKGMKDDLQSTIHQTSNSSLALEGSCRALLSLSSTRQPCYSARSQEKQRGLCTAVTMTHAPMWGLSSYVGGQGYARTGKGRQAGICARLCPLGVCPNLISVAAAAVYCGHTHTREGDSILSFPRRLGSL